MSKNMKELILDRIVANVRDLATVHLDEILLSAVDSGEFAVTFASKVKGINGKVPFVKTGIGSTKRLSDSVEGWVEDPEQPALPFEERGRRVGIVIDSTGIHAGEGAK
jgi:hypothetical protein